LLKEVGSSEQLTISLRSAQGRSTSFLSSISCINRFFFFLKGEIERLASELKTLQEELASEKKQAELAAIQATHEKELAAQELEQERNAHATELGLLEAKLKAFQEVWTTVTIVNQCGDC